MPSASKSTKKAPTRRVAKRTTANARRARSLSSAHKNALAAGRTESAVVNRYLSALNTPKKRGRKVSAATLRARLQSAETRARAALGVDRLLAHQEARDLRARIAADARSAATDLKALERDFERVAKSFSERRGIRYGSWRDAGVPAPVLKRAGIPRTRG